MKEKALIFAVDDDESIRDVYSYALNNEHFKTTCFSCGNELFSKLQTSIPDLIILDIMLDHASGYEILEDLRSDVRFKQIPVIMVSAKSSEIDKVKGLNLGANDYITKPFGIMELNARINAIFRTISLFNKKSESYKELSINQEEHRIYLLDEPLSLTLKEYELFSLLIQNAKKVLTRNEILDAIWGINYGETRTLDIHIAKLRKILEKTTIEIETVRGIGYMLK